ncbi:MAG TPA: hypothetical protein VGZ47_01025 [Gemmataceae bacterium]|jgi:hypothetical protein|nr:hypothetical protein [Gemmataceae bacterium]
MNAKTSSTDPLAEDGLHRLLRDFFQAEMAKTSFSPPDVGLVAPAPKPQQRSTLLRSRIVLALSLLLVLSSLWFLLGNRSGSVLPPPAGVENSAAHRHDLFQPEKPAKPDSSTHR